MKQNISTALAGAIILASLAACNSGSSTDNSSSNNSSNTNNGSTGTTTNTNSSTGTGSSPDTTSGTNSGNGQSNATADALSKVFAKQTSIFSIPIFATASTSDNAIKHAANIMAEYLDNNEDGVPDNQAVVDRMIENQSALMIAATDSEMESLHDLLPESDALQDLYESEIHPNGASQGRFDASLEEVLHLITHTGFASVYPQTFGESSGSVIADAMDIARGGHFTSIPSSYPAGAWYTYDDTTCNYSCMVTEYTYWALTSILGGQDFSGRYEEISHEWKLNTPEKVQTQDTAAYTLLTDAQYALPSQLPDGQYAPKSFEITLNETTATSSSGTSSTGSPSTGTNTSTDSNEEDEPARFSFKDNNPDSSTVIMEGVINSNTLDDIKNLFDQNPQITTLIMQNVPGSSDDEINLLASREIRQRGIATHIPADGMVASGGTDMFLAGIKRTIDAGARLGVHSWSTGDQEATDFPRSDSVHSSYLNYYMEMGIDTEFYWYTLEAAPADDIHWMTDEEIERYGVLTE